VDTPTDGKYLPVGSMIELSSYPAFAALYPARDRVDTFTAQMPAPERSVRFVATDGTRLVMVARNSLITLYSDDDGVTWRNGGTLPSSGEWSGVAYGGGVWVAVKRSSSAAAYSSDGISWTAATLPASVAWYAVAYGGGVFVATASGTATAAYSADGITWSSSTLPTSGNWYGLAYGNGRFVAVRDSSTAAAYSTDGVTWNASTLPTSAKHQSAGFGNGLFLVPDETGGNLATSTDGVTWASVALPMATAWRALTTHGGGVFLLLTAGVTGYLAYSFDAVTWKTVYLGGTPDRVGGVYHKGRFISPLFVVSAGAIPTFAVSTPSSTHVMLTGPTGYYVRVR
jgi:hypothetical protein